MTYNITLTVHIKLFYHTRYQGFNQLWRLAEHKSFSSAYISSTMGFLLKHFKMFPSFRFLAMQCLMQIDKTWLGKKFGEVESLTWTWQKLGK